MFNFWFNNAILYKQVKVYTFNKYISAKILYETTEFICFQGVNNNNKRENLKRDSVILPEPQRAGLRLSSWLSWHTK